MLGHCSTGSAATGTGRNRWGECRRQRRLHLTVQTGIESLQGALAGCQPADSWSDTKWSAREMTPDGAEWEFSPLPLDLPEGLRDTSWVQLVDSCLALSGRYLWVSVNAAHRQAACPSVDRHFVKWAKMTVMTAKVTEKTAVLRDCRLRWAQLSLRGASRLFLQKQSAPTHTHSTHDYCSSPCDVQHWRWRRFTDRLGDSAGLCKRKHTIMVLHVLCHYFLLQHLNNSR